MSVHTSLSRMALPAIALAAAVAVATPAAALLVQPVVIRLDSTGNHSSAAITAVNDRNRNDTIEVTVSKLTLPEKGPPVLTPDKGDDFLVFPPIAVIPPGKTQVFRIRWIGEPVLPEARTYMFTTSEVPIDEKKGSGVQLIYAIQSVVTVTSPTLKSLAHVDSLVRGTHDYPGGDGKPARTESGLSVAFSNVGENVAFLSEYQMKLSIAGNPGWSKTIEPRDMSQYVGLGLVPPNGKRDLFLPIPDVPPTGDITVTLKPPSGG